MFSKEFTGKYKDFYKKDFNGNFFDEETLRQTKK